MIERERRLVILASIQNIRAEVERLLHLIEDPLLEEEHQEAIKERSQVQYEKQRERSRAYYQNNKDKQQAYGRAYYQKHKDKQQAYGLAYYHSHKQYFADYQSKKQNETSS